MIVFLMLHPSGLSPWHFGCLIHKLFSLPFHYSPIHCLGQYECFPRCWNQAGNDMLMSFTIENGSLTECVSNFSMCKNHPERWLQHRSLGPSPEVLIPQVWRGPWELPLWVSELPGDAEAAALGTTLPGGLLYPAFPGSLGASPFWHF